MKVAWLSMVVAVRTCFRGSGYNLAALCRSSACRRVISRGWGRTTQPQFWALGFGPLPALELASLERDSAVAVLDVGGGYGVVSEEILRAFPQVRVTLQDYSQPMLDHARRQLSGYGDRVSYVAADLCDPSWIDRVAGPFDLIVSAIAIHNLANLERISACYGGIVRLLKPGSSFLDYDLFEIVGGVALHMKLLKAVGFARVDCTWQQTPAAIIAAHSHI
jgi:ubiquinone/menaquinone biosynthesis C-methylase UbiE